MEKGRTWKETKEYERDMKRAWTENEMKMKGTWNENERTWKGNGKEHERNMEGKWSVQRDCGSVVRSSELSQIFVFALDLDQESVQLEYAISPNINCGKQSAVPYCSEACFSQVSYFAARVFCWYWWDGGTEARLQGVVCFSFFAHAPNSFESWTTSKTSDTPVAIWCRLRAENCTWMWQVWRFSFLSKDIFYPAT